MCNRHDDIEGVAIGAGAPVLDGTQADHTPAAPTCAPAPPPLSEELGDLIMVREALDRIVDDYLLGIRPDTHELIESVRILGRVVDNRIQAAPVKDGR